MHSPAHFEGGLGGTSSAASGEAWIGEALAAGGVGVWAWDLAGGTISADAVARSLWALPQREAITPAQVVAAIHLDDVDQARAAALVARLTGDESEITVRIGLPGGAVRWIRVRGRVIGSRDSRRCVGVTLDVTARMRAEDALRATEERLQRAQEFGGALPFEWDARRNRLFAPAALKQLYGLQPEDVLDLDVLLAKVHPDDRQRVADDHRRLLQTDPGPYEAEFRIVLPDGSLRWILSRGQSLLGDDGAATGIAGINIDITSRKEAEDELRRARREARARFREIRDLYHNAPVGLALLDPDFTTQRLNHRLAALIGIDPGDGVGRTIFDSAPDLREAFEPVLRGVMTTGEPVGNVPARRPAPGRPDEALSFNCHFYPLKDEDGAVLGIGLVVEDVTAYRSAVEGRDLLSRELSHRIKNLFAVVSSLITLSSGADPVLRAFARTVRGRIEALGRAHDYVRPVEWDGTGTRPRTLHTLLAILLEPYRGGPEAGGRVSVAGDDPAIGSFAATTLALAIHEFATNALKHGALSAPGGAVAISCRLDAGRLELTWQETGGPPVSGPPARAGFGSRLAHRTVVSDLNGTIEPDWAPEGLTIRLSAPMERLAR